MNKNKIYKIGLILIFLWFLIQTIYIATTIKYNIASDEFYHYELIKIYKDKNNILPFITEQTDNFGLRDITRYPSYFYHYFLGNILKIPNIQNQDTEILLLRFINIGLNLGTIFVFLKTMEELTKSKWVKFLALIMLTNTLMYVFISMGINYDNLLNLFSMLLIYILIKFIKTENIKYFLYFLTLSLFTMITKFSAGPLLLPAGLILLFNIYNQTKEKNIQYIRNKYIKNIKKLKPPTKIILTSFFLIGTILFTERYGINLIKYKTLKQPKCDQIHTVEQCMESGVYKRNKSRLDLLKKEPWRDDFTLWDFTKNWTENMMRRTYGMMVHKWLHPNEQTLKGITLIFLLATLYFIAYFDLHKKRLKLYIFLISLFYTLFIFYFLNFKKQKKYGYLGLAVQGRYIFPVLPLWYYLLNSYIIKGLNKTSSKLNKLFKFSYANIILKIIFISSVIIIFISSSFFWYLKKAGEDWYRNNHKPYLIKQYFN